jgi:hypothetical protein
MTANERLFSAGLVDAYDNAVASGDLEEINRVLAQIGLRQDRTGMNWSIEHDAGNF